MSSQGPGLLGICILEPGYNNSETLFVNPDQMYSDFRKCESEQFTLFSFPLTLLDQCSHCPCSLTMNSKIFWSSWVSGRSRVELKVWKQIIIKKTSILIQIKSWNSTLLSQPTFSKASILARSSSSSRAPRDHIMANTNSRPRCFSSAAGSKP